jgi:Protein of unknown function (DUF4232)
MRATTIRRGILLGLSLAATLTVAACAAGNQPGSAGPGTSHTVPPPSASTPASAGISTASPTASAAAAGSGVPMCTAADLRASLGGGAGAGMSQDHTGVQLRNIGSSACSLRGYPGVFWVAGANDHQVGSAAVREPESASSPEQTVTLAPGATASAPLDIVDAAAIPQPECKPVPVSGLQVYPPGGRAALFIRLATPGGYGECSLATTQPTLIVGYVQPGVQPGGGSAG